MGALELTLLYLLAAVLGVVACRSLKLPPMLGYLAVGVVIGPNALALAQNSDGVRHLGEFGVVFLMFVIGLEFNLAKLRAMRNHVFGLGLFQVALAYFFLNRGLRQVPALESSALLLAEPALNPVWAWLLMGERQGTMAMAGGVLILGASAARLLRDYRK